MSRVSLPVDCHGLPITEELLLALLATEVRGEAGKVSWSFHARGYEFTFTRTGPHHWDFTGPGSPPGGHCASHLDEVFGCIAKDMFEAGRDTKAMEVRHVLGVHQPGDENIDEP